MGYQPYAMQVRPRGHPDRQVPGERLGARWPGSTLLIPPPSPHWAPQLVFQVRNSPLVWLQGSLPSPQNLMTALPSQDASLPPPPQPYISGQQPMYQQVSPVQGAVLGR